MKVELRGIHRIKRKISNGRVIEYHYAFRGGPKIWQSDSDFAIGSPEYLDAFQRASTLPAGAIQSSKKFSLIIRKYSVSDDFRRLADRTKRDYRKWLTEIEGEFADTPVSAFNSNKIRNEAFEWIDNWSGRQRLYAWQVLSRLTNWAYNRGLLEYAHLKDGKVSYKGQRNHIIWHDDEIEAFNEVASPAIARALAAAVETGLRPGDLVKLSRRHIEKTPRGRRIFINTNKRSRDAAIPVLSGMAQIIDTTPSDDLLILRSDTGKPWTVTNLGRKVKEAAREAGLQDELQMRDARGTAVTRLIEADVPIPSIAIHMGWDLKSAAEMVEIYAKLSKKVTDKVLFALEDFRKQQRQN